MNENHVYDMIIVGGGPGGYTSALYAARAGLETIVLEKLSAGGQMSLTWQIDNYPGFETVSYTHLHSFTSNGHKIVKPVMIVVIVIFFIKVLTELI